MIKKVVTDNYSKYRDAVPNKQANNYCIAVSFIMALMTFLNLIKVYDALDTDLMILIFFVTLALVYLTGYICHNEKYVSNRSSKFIIMGAITLHNMLLSVILNIHVTMLLPLPILISVFYYDQLITLMASIGCWLVCLLAPLFAYCLNTFSFKYLSGYIEVVCHIHIDSFHHSVNILQDVQNILMYKVLPEMIMLLVFAVIMYRIAANGQKNYQREREIHQITTRDELTGIMRKEYFFNVTGNYLKEHKEEQFLLVVCDIFQFKVFNDIFGYDAGDKILIKLANFVKHKGHNTGLYGRIGSGHFAFVINKDEFDRNVFGKEVKNYIGYKYAYDYNLTIYSGVYEIKDVYKPVSSMVDRALLAAKNCYNGKEVEYYADHMRNQVVDEQLLLQQLANAVSRKEFVIALQPQFDNEKKMKGAEVLVRWNHPTKGVLYPKDFIATAEKSGLITQIDLTVWEMVCQLLAKWKKENIPYYLSINISPADLYRMNIEETISGLVNKYDIEASKLKLEITESSIMLDIDRQLELIERLQKLGFTIEMDDFGSGYSSLSMLNKINVDVLKLDLAFIKDGKDIEKSRIIMDKMVSMIRELKLGMVIEGVENQRQFDFLKERGCDCFQGYYFSAAVSVEEFESKYI